MIPSKNLKRYGKIKFNYMRMSKIKNKIMKTF